MSAVKSTMFTAPSRTDVPITPLAVILNASVAAPAWPVISDIALFRLWKTPIASSARYSTDVATIATTKSTSETANENFITDHGSIRLRCNRARRGPRPGPAAAPARALRIASDTRAEPTPPTDTGAVASPVARRPMVDVARTLARATAGPGTTGADAVTPGMALTGVPMEATPSAAGWT